MTSTDAPSSAYVETTIFSYLTARTSGDLVTAAHQRMTAQWWSTAPVRHRLVSSAVVMQEVQAGNAVMAARRLEVMSDIPLLTVSLEARALALELRAAGLLPADAGADALHVVVAAMHRVTYLVTWNLRHIAGAVVRRRIEHALRARGFDPPILCTPEELLASNSTTGEFDVS